MPSPAFPVSVVEVLTVRVKPLSVTCAVPWWSDVCAHEDLVSMACQSEPESAPLYYCLCRYCVGTRHPDSFSPLATASRRLRKFPFSLIMLSSPTIGGHCSSQVPPCISRRRKGVQLAQVCAGNGRLRNRRHRQRRSSLVIYNEGGGHCQSIPQFAWS